MVDASERPSRRVAMKEVAKRAGVAPSSVSRVLTDHPQVSDVMRNRVMDAVAALGYERDLVAQTLRSGVSLVVGFVAGDISNPLIAGIAEGAESVLRDANYSMLLTNSGSSPEMDQERIRLLRQRRVDALIASLADDTMDATLKTISDSALPTVLIDRELLHPAQMSAVLSDHARGMSAAADHLAELGHRHIALVNGPATVRPARLRATTLRRAGKALGLKVTIKSGPFTAAHGFAATQAALAASPRPTALIAGSNQILGGVLRALRSEKLTVPTDVSLVTCDDVPLSEFLSPPLATISRDPREMGQVAARLVLERLSGGGPSVVTLPTAFRPAASCSHP